MAANGTVLVIADEPGEFALRERCATAQCKDAVGNGFGLFWHGAFMNFSKYDVFRFSVPSHPTPS